MTLSQIKIHFRFHSNSLTNDKGFHIEYSTLEFFTSCGGSFSNSNGILTSPSHPNQYPELAHCVYLISQPNGTYVNISFPTIGIDCQEIGSLSDFIEMRDGYYEDSPLIGKFCGNISDMPDFIITTQNFLRIR